MALSNRERLALLKEAMIRRARVDFWYYRRVINPVSQFKIGWWQKEISEALMQFWGDFKAGLRPKLVIEAPPQHGKSTQIRDFISWIAGLDPALKTIYASYSERLGVRCNLSLQRIYDSKKYQEIFPETQINNSNVVTISGQCLRNREILEYVDKGGFFRNTTVRGSITGESLDIGVIDDPIKGRQEANSPTVRDATWNWFTDDFFTRFSEDAALLIILTRWHVDDPVGRLCEDYDGVKTLKYPAIATEDEEHRKEGEPLFPEWKSLEFLLERKRIMASTSWESLYQQNPFIAGGQMFKASWWQYYKRLPRMRRRIIYADTAMKIKEQNDFSVFQCWGVSYANQIYLLDQIRGKWESPELRVQAKAFWNKHQAVQGLGLLVAFKVEDKASGTDLIQTIKRDAIPIVGIQRDIDKVSRANDVLTYIEAGHVFLPSDVSWLSSYLTEFEQFPNGKHDDQVDPTMDAIADSLSTGVVNYDGLA